MREEQLQFNFELKASTLTSEYYREGAQDLIRRIVPPDLLKEKGDMLQKARFADMLPLISWSDLSKAPCSLSVLILFKYRFNGSNFFYDMISRWLIPGEQLNVEVFFASDVRIPHLCDDLLSVAEIVISLKSVQDAFEVRRNMKTLETELRLGIVSQYQARRILEFKGLSSDGKTAMIQEKIGSLIQSHSKDFEKGIFAQMQQFLVTCPEEFKNDRDYHHISRIISNIYHVRKLLKQNVDVTGTKRHIHLKFLKTYLSSQLCVAGSKSEETKYVLGILVGMNFLAENEVFEKTHLMSAIQKHITSVKAVDGSCFIDRSHGSLQTLYLEIQKPEANDFTIEEIQMLRTGLREQIQEHIGHLAHPIFMPRNEEEVLRNIMTLSGEIRYVNDLPHVIITFDEQKGEDLSFTVILLKVQPVDAPSLQAIFAASSTPLIYIPDRVRRVGHVRKRYVKEATVFRTQVNSLPFLRSDCSIDLYKARSYIFSELCKLVGAIRDYNGGMIYKQNALLEDVKSSLGKVAVQYRLLLEKFYYSLNPIEMRTAVDVEELKEFFLLFLQVAKTDTQKNDFLYRQDEKKAMAIIPVTGYKQKKLSEQIESVSIPHHQLVSFSLETEGAYYSGYLLLSEDKELQSQFLSSLEVL